MLRVALKLLFCNRHFGAEIIKVEPPNTGDPLRVWRELDVDGTSPWFRSLARNKKSVSIDMRKEKGRVYVVFFFFLFPFRHPSKKPNQIKLLLSSLVRRLADHSDVVIENFKPGSMCIFPVLQLSINPR
jgi:CoA-transferase family III